jgi:hypothetical protein
MYPFTQKSGHAVWRKRWYAFTSGVSLPTNLYMTQEDQVFIVDVVVIDQMWEVMVQVSLVNHHVQLWNLVSLLKSASIEGFMTGTILF